MNKQYVCRNGKQSIKQARNLIARVAPTQEALDQTVEMLSSQEVLYKEYRYGTVAYVRSSFSPRRYYPMVWDTERNAWNCTCHQGCKFHKHTRMVNQYLEAQKNVVA